MVSKSSEIALASMCPRAVYLRHKHGAEETKEMRLGAAKHTNFTKDVEHTLHVRKHRGAYITALIVIILLILFLSGAAYFGFFS